MAKDPRIETGSRPRQLPPEAHIRMHFEKFSSFVAEYSSKLSLGGMFVVTRDPRPVGSEVAFDLKLADGFRLFHGHGEVAWVRLAEGGLPPGMALRFIALDEKGRELVLKVLEEQVKSGGLPFEIDPPPADALLDYSGPPAAGPAFTQLEMPLAADLGEEPTMITGRRRSLDETGFDAPWGQKLPEVPTDLLDENESGPAVPSVSEVQFAPLNPPQPVTPPVRPPRPAAAGSASGSGSQGGQSSQSSQVSQTGLFAAAFPGRNAAGESPVDLGFVLDENPPAARAQNPPDSLPGEAAWALGGGAFQGIAQVEDPLVDFEPLTDETPFEPEPSDYAMPAFGSEEPTLIGAAAGSLGEEPTVIGSRRLLGQDGISLLPANGIFEVGPGASASPAAAGPAADPDWEALPAAPVPATPYEVWQASPADPFVAAPADPFAPAPADPFGPAPADPFGPAPADPFSTSPAPLPPRVVAPPEIEAYTPFDLGRPAAGLADAAEGFGLGPPPASFPPPAAPPAAPAAAFPSPPSIFPAGYFGGGEAGAEQGQYASAGEDWQDDDEAPSKSARLKAALFSRKAILGLAATALLVTGAYFLAGDYLGSRDSGAVAEGPPEGSRLPPRRPAPATESTAEPAAEPAADPSAPERVVARPDEEPDGGAVALPPAADSSSEPSSRPSEPPARVQEPAAPPQAPPAADPAPPRATSARWLMQIEVKKGSGQTVVDLIFDGEVDTSSYVHNPMSYTQGKEQLTFPGIEGSRSANRQVNSPELNGIRCGAHPGELRVVFDRPSGAKISNISPEGKRVRVLLDR